MIKFTIPVVPRTKKNSQEIRYKNCKGRRVPFISPSALYKQFEEECCWLIPKKYKLKIDYPVNVKALYFVKRNGRVDITNLESALMDALVKAEVLADDSAIKPAIVVSTDGSRVYYDKDNPRIEVEIERME